MKIVLEMPKRTWRMRFTDARLWWWWRFGGRHECLGKRWYQR